MGGQSFELNGFGAFRLSNVSAPDQFGPGRPGTRPDFVGDDYLRIVGVSTLGGTNRYAFSDFFKITQGQTVRLQNLTFTDVAPKKPDMLAAVPDQAILTGALGQTTQVRVTATFADKTTGDVSPATSWTSYRTSNVAVATVDANGLVTGTGSGIAYITAVNEGATAVAQGKVVPGDPLTTVKGYLRRPDGLPAVGAVVSISGLGLSATVGADGSFTFSNVPTTLGSLTLSAVVVEGGGRLVAVTRNLPPVAGGVLDAGILTLTPFQAASQTKAIAAGSVHIVALKTYGSLWAWGANSSGQLGDGTRVNKVSPVRIATGNDWAEIAASSDHTVARKTDGSLWAWGYNDFGQLGDGTTASRLNPVRIGTCYDWVEIATGIAHTVARKADGSLWAWGFNSSGNLGDGTAITKLSPVRIGTGNDWAGIDAGALLTVASKLDGSVWAWGDNSQGQLGDGTTANKLSPVRIGTSNDWAEITAGYSHTVARKIDGSLWAWGYNFFGQLGDGTAANRLIPVRIGTSNDWAEVKGSNVGQSSFTVGRKTDGSLWAWGRNECGQLGDGTMLNYRPTPVRIATGSDWTEIAPGGTHSVAHKTDGSLWAWGLNEYGELGDGTSGNRRLTPTRLGIRNDWAQITAVAARKTDGSIWAWGDLLNTGGGYTLSPVRIGTDNHWARLASSGSHKVVRKNDGSLWAWGNNYYGQLGDATTVSKLIPVRIGTGNDWEQIVAGDSYTVASKTDGGLWAWGMNRHGQLGDGTTVDKLSPVRIGTGNDWAQIAAGQVHTLARKTNDSLWAWGSNSSVQLGDETAVSKLSPVRVGTDNNWAQVAAGSGHSVALKIDGSLWGWGSNSSGQLGDGNTLYGKPSPVRIGTDNDWAEVAAGYEHTVARKTDGSLWAWGANSSGQLGDGTIVNKVSPVRIGTDNDWAEITTSSARKTDGSVWAWGDNQYGQLGIDYIVGPIGGTYDWGVPPIAPAPAPPSRVPPLLDSDGDGIPDAQELLAGTDPHDPASVLRLSQLDKTATGMQMQFPTLTGKTYRLEYTDGLTTHQWHPLTAPIPGDGHPVQVVDPAGATRPQRFYRLKVVEP